MPDVTSFSINWVAINISRKSQLTAMEEKMVKMMEDMEALQRENTDLQQNHCVKQYLPP